MSSSTANRRVGAVASEHAANANATVAASNDRATENATDEMNDDKGKPVLRAALIFGIVAATIEMGVVLWMMYC
jgi:hypothetical protein